MYLFFKKITCVYVLGKAKLQTDLEKMITNQKVDGFQKQNGNRGSWVAQSVKRLTLAQVMNSQFLGSSPASGSMLTTQSQELA